MLFDVFEKGTKYQDDCFCHGVAALFFILVTHQLSWTYGTFTMFTTVSTLEVDFDAYRTLIPDNFNIKTTTAVVI